MRIMFSGDPDELLIHIPKTRNRMMVFVVTAKRITEVLNEGQMAKYRRGGRYFNVPEKIIKDLFGG